MERVEKWLKKHAHDVHRSLVARPTEEKIAAAMGQLGADASAAAEAWFRMTGGQDWANAPDGALPPNFLFPLDEAVQLTLEMRERGALPPRAAMVVGCDFDETQHYLVLDSNGVFWSLNDGWLTKVADSADELIGMAVKNLGQPKAALRGWLPNHGQTLRDEKVWVTYGLLGLLSVGSLAGLALIPGLHAFTFWMWLVAGLAMGGVLLRALWHDARGKGWSRAVMADRSLFPEEPWKANEYWRRKEGFPLEKGAPALVLSDTPVRLGDTVKATVAVPVAEATISCVQLLSGRAYWSSYDLEKLPCICKAEGDGAVITMLTMEGWPVVLPGTYANRAVLWQANIRVAGDVYRYWLPVVE